MKKVSLDASLPSVSIIVVSCSKRTANSWTDKIHVGIYPAMQAYGTVRFRR